MGLGHDLNRVAFPPSVGEHAIRSQDVGHLQDAEPEQVRRFWSWRILRHS